LSSIGNDWPDRDWECQAREQAAASVYGYMGTLVHNDKVRQSVVSKAKQCKAWTNHWLRSESDPSL
jgi:hypothetical protein